MPSIRLLAFFLLFAAYSSSVVQASIMATGFFSGTIERFDHQTMAQSTFATIASGSDPFPGLSGIAYSRKNNRLYATARISDRIYSVDASTGAVLGFHQLPGGSAPAGVTIDSAGQVYVANNGGNTVSVFDAIFNPVDTITLPDIGLGDNLPNGLAFDSQNRLVISTFAGGGVFRYDPMTDMATSFIPSPLANGQVAIAGAGNAFIGGAAFSSDVLQFDSTGTEMGSPFLTIDGSILPQPPLSYASPDFTSPAGITIDGDGNLIVAALGRTNPTNVSDNFQSNGGLFKFSPDGVLLGTFGIDITPLSAVTIVSFVPEPGSAWLIAIGLLTFCSRRFDKSFAASRGA